MRLLRKKYSKIAQEVSCWGYDDCRRMKRIEDR